MSATPPTVSTFPSSTWRTRPSSSANGPREPGLGLGPTRPFALAHGSCLCVPSQNGICFECLQAHQATVPASLISTFCGPSPVPLCEPSQNGWLAERPHAHHQYVPGSTFCTIGAF